MTRTLKSVLSFGALVLAAGVLTLALPRAAHAVAVALVQVGNTPAAPAVTQDMGRAASQLVLLGAPDLTIASASGITALVRIMPDQAPTSSPFMVPTGQNLVVTEVEFNNLTANNAASLLGPGGNGGGLIQGYVEYSLPNLGSQLFHYASGMVYPSGSSVLMAASGNAGVFVHGYLTPN